MNETSLKNESFSADNVVEARQGNQSGGGQKPGPLQKIIRGIMMIPLAIQVSTFLNASEVFKILF